MSEPEGHDLMPNDGQSQDDSATNSKSINVMVNNGPNGFSGRVAVPLGATVSFLFGMLNPVLSIELCAISENSVQCESYDQALSDGDRVSIASARVNAGLSVPSSSRRPGLAKGMVLHMAPDFNAPLEDFKEYME